MNNVAAKPKPKYDAKKGKFFHTFFQNNTTAKVAWQAMPATDSNCSKDFNVMRSLKDTVAQT